MKTFGERKMYRDHLKYDFSCWKLRKQEERRTERKRNETRNDCEYGYESDSGRGSSSESSSCNDEEVVNPAIRMTLGQSQNKQFEVLMVSENLSVPKSRRVPVVKEKNIETQQPANPMVIIKSEILEDLHNKTVKEEDALIPSNNLQEVPEIQDTKPNVFTAISKKPENGIRMLIDKNNMSVVMASGHLEDKEVPNEENSLENGDVKPMIEEVGQNIQIGIKMTVAKEKADKNYTVTMSSEVAPIDIFDTEFTMCSNNECPKIGNHVCAFPLFRETGGFYKTKGILSIKKSHKTGKPKFVPFNHSFLKTLGCSFYFKAFHSHVEVRCRSTNSKKGERYKMFLYENNMQSSTVGTLGSSKFKSSSCIPTNSFNGNFIKYTIIIDKQPRSCHLYQ